MSKIDKKKLKKQVEERLEDLDIFGEILVPAEEYSQLAESYKKSDDFTGKKKKKILPIIFASVGVVGLGAGGFGLYWGLSHQGTTTNEIIDITLELNGGKIDGTEETVISIKKGSTVAQLPKPTKDHAVFEGWYQDKELTEKLATDFVLNENITIYAKYIDNITFKFNLCGGKIKTTRETEYSVEIQPTATWKDLPKPVVEKDNGVFEGWYQDQECTNQWEESMSVTEGTGQAFAKWNSSILTCQVSFDVGDGYIPEGEGTKTTVAYKGDTFQEINKPNVLHTDSIFSGWYHDQTTKISDDYEINSNMTAYAHFTKKTDVEATVTFVINKEQGETSSGTLVVAFNKGASFESINKPSVYKNGMICSEWIDENGKTITGILNASIKAYPKWTVSHTITFDAGDGSIVSGKPTIAVADETTWSTIRHPTVERKYFKFDYWYYLDAEGKQIKLEDTYVIKNDLTVYAYYLPTEKNISIDGLTKITNGLDYQYTAVYDPESLATEGTTWGVYSDEACSTTTTIAEIDGNGKLTTKGSGIVYIKATSNMFSDCSTKIKVQINEPYIDSTDFWCIAEDSGWYKFNKSSLCSETQITATSIKDETKQISFERTATNIPTIYVGTGIVEIPELFLNNCTNFTNQIIFPDNNKLVMIGEMFMTGCTAFNSEININNCSKLQYIENGFMQKCSSWNNNNQELILPDGLLRIYEDFLWKCKAFNQNITLPNSLIQVSKCFLEECDNMTSTVTINCGLDVFEESVYSFATDNKDAPCYKQGIQVEGVTQDEIDALFPKSSIEPYRNIIANE